MYGPLSLSVLWLVKLFNLREHSQMVWACLMELNHQGREEVAGFPLSSSKKENCYFSPQNQQFHVQGCPKWGEEGVEA